MSDFPIIPEPLKYEFFLEAGRTYPNALNHFSRWFLGYQNSLRWREVFIGKALHSIHKFWDLPYAFQLGIWMEYITRDKDSGYVFRYSRITYLSDEIMYYFHELEKEFEPIRPIENKEKLIPESKLRELFEKFLEDIKTTSI